MADTFTTDGVGAILMGIGGDNNTWGTNLNNSAIQVFADALCNQLVSSATGGTLDLSGTPPPAATSQAHHSALVFNGVLTSNLIVILPNLQKWWWVANATAGAFTLTLQVSGGGSLVIPQQGAGFFPVRCNGTGALLFAQAVYMPVDGSTAIPGYSFLNEQNTGWRRAGTQDLRLVVGGADVLQVTGAGASTPSVVNILSPESLQVAGTSVGTFTTGDVKLTFKTAADPGWVMMDDSTLGDASSNATHASAANSALFQLLYNNISDADAPILTSGGAATTRGAQGSAATAFANHCRLTLPLTLGRALAAAGSGAGLTARTLGHALGEETHQLTTGEMPAHNHSGTTDNADAAGGTPVDSNVSGNTVNFTANAGGAPAIQTLNQTKIALTHNHTFTTGSAGGGGAHNNMQPSAFLNVMIKL
jgi:microcystin-dependent protein